MEAYVRLFMTLEERSYQSAYDKEIVRSCTVRPLPRCLDAQANRYTGKSQKYSIRSDHRLSFRS